MGTFSKEYGGHHDPQGYTAGRKEMEYSFHPSSIHISETIQKTTHSNTISNTDTHLTTLKSPTTLPSSSSPCAQE